MRQRRVLPAAVIALLLGTGSATAERVLFTTRTAWASPVVVSGPLASKEFGFQSVLLHNISSKTVEALDFKVVLITAAPAGGEAEEVDGGRIHVRLEPGQSRRIDVYLGQVRALEQKAHSLRLNAALTVLSVASADFADGTRWDGEDAPAPVDAPIDSFPGLRNK
jgi:hypothetical protein